MSIQDRRRRLAQAIHGTITADGARSAQKSVGPSEIGNPCGRCLGKALTRKYPELWWEAAPPTPEHPSSKHKAWLGTAVHEKLEREVQIEGSSKEYKVFITHLDGYGDIHGHCDLFAERTVVDYKTADLDNILEYRLKGPPSGNVFQIHTYGFGFENAGYDVEDVCLFYIPRDSNDADDCWPAFARYDRQIAEVALDRLEAVWLKVREGRGHELTSHEQCWTCRVKYKRRKRM